jgi:hypothetical protein
MTACALVIVEHNVRNYSDERSSRPHTPNTPGTPRTPNGLLQKFPTWRDGDDEVAWTIIRDMAAIVAIACMLVSLSFESFKTWQWTYRDSPGPGVPGELPAKIRVLGYEWNAKDDFLGILIECATAALMLLLVCSTLLYLVLPLTQTLTHVKSHQP